METSHSNSHPFLNEITITPDLWTRPSHASNVDLEADAMRRLAETLASDPSQVFQVCVEAALSLCQADTCGISLREKAANGDDIFRWIALTGQLKEHLSGTTPRHFSPCGICVELGSPVLMKRPELFYKYLDVGPAFEDVLLIPLTEIGSQLEGTIWVVAHNKDRKFDGEDARMMQRLAVFTATALQLATRVHEAEMKVAAQQLLFLEFDHRVKNTLTMTAGLLRHQLRYTVLPEVRTALEMANARVSTIGHVHQIAHGAANGDLAEILDCVCADIAGPEHRFDIIVAAEPLKVSAQKAAVVALIANELIMNAVKHGLSDDRPNGRVDVRLHRIGNFAELSVTDDGAPLKPSTPDGQGIGMTLVTRLTDQLAGELKINYEPKQFTVTFPLSPAR